MHGCQLYCNFEGKLMMALFKVSELLHLYFTGFNKKPDFSKKPDLICYKCKNLTPKFIF